MKIAIVEDNETLRNELAELLSKNGYEVFTPVSFSHADQEVLESRAHLVLLDLNLPVYDGFYLCRQLRRQSDMPIIVITSRDTELDELMSMNLGADDFVTKPFHTQILLARIASLLRRVYRSAPSDAMHCGDVTLYRSDGTVEGPLGRCELSKNEMKILSCMVQNQGRIVTREELMNLLWQSDEFIDDNTLTVNINRLRKKLEQVGKGDLIRTRRGQGYLVEGEGQ